MDKDMGTNDFTKCYKYCKDCVFQNQDKWYKGRCKVFTLTKPEYVRNNEECEFYVKTSTTKN